jgi:hypothetical protein
LGADFTLSEDGNEFSRLTAAFDVTLVPRRTRKTGWAATGTTVTTSPNFIKIIQSFEPIWRQTCRMPKVKITGTLQTSEITTSARVSPHFVQVTCHVLKLPALGASVAVFVTIRHAVTI